jgi:hypothetical protein
MSQQFFPYVAAVVGVLIVGHVIRMYILLRKRAFAVVEARVAVAVDTAPLRVAKGDDDTTNAYDSRSHAEIMIKQYNNREGAQLLYNRAVASYNKLLTTYPSAFFAYMLGFEKEQLIDIAGYGPDDATT